MISLTPTRLSTIEGQHALAAQLRMELATTDDDDRYYLGMSCKASPSFTQLLDYRYIRTLPESDYLYYILANIHAKGMQSDVNLFLKRRYADGKIDMNGEIFQAMLKNGRLTAAEAYTLSKDKLGLFKMMYKTYKSSKFFRNYMCMELSYKDIHDVVKDNYGKFTPNLLEKYEANKGKRDRDNTGRDWTINSLLNASMVDGLCIIDPAIIYGHSDTIDMFLEDTSKLTHPYDRKKFAIMYLKNFIRYAGYFKTVAGLDNALCGTLSTMRYAGIKLTIDEIPEEFLKLVMKYRYSHIKWALGEDECEAFITKHNIHVEED